MHLSSFIFGAKNSPFWKVAQESNAFEKVIVYCYRRESQQQLLCLFLFLLLLSFQCYLVFLLRSFLFFAEDFVKSTKFLVGGKY